MTDLLTLPGIGKLAKERIRQRGLPFVEDLDAYIMGHRTSLLKDFVHLISLNPRRDECLEGYYPRKHNKRVKDGLITQIKRLKPLFEMNDYRTSRVPAERQNDPVIRCDTRTLGPFVSYDNSPGNQGTVLREGVPFRGIPGSGYRYGKACLPPEDLTLVERDAEIRTNPVYRNRRHYKCSCFRSLETCNDMSPARGNRLLKRDGRPKDPYCRWQDNRCQSIL
jgi:hypothetical protein